MFKKLLLLGFLFISLTGAVFAYSEDNISALEYAKYGTDYPNESLGERLNRLEQDYFGMSQTGDIDSRLANLSKLNTNARNGINLYSYPTYGNYYDNTKSKSKLRNFWDNLSSGFFDNGYMTGFTPSMNTMSSSGYNDDIYKNNLYNSLNNPAAFCPYDNRYHNRSSLRHSGYYNNRYYNKNRYFNGVNRFVPKYSHNLPNMNYHPYYGVQSPYGYIPNNRAYTNRTSFYLPPNVETKSSIHILRD